MTIPILTILGEKRGVDGMRREGKGGKGRREGGSEELNGSCERREEIRRKEEGRKRREGRKQESQSKAHIHPGKAQSPRPITYKQNSRFSTVHKTFKLLSLITKRCNTDICQYQIYM